MSKNRGLPPLMSSVPNYNQFFRSAENTNDHQIDDMGGPRDFQNRQIQGQGPRQNAIEKRLNQALQQPVDLGKGESMMKKMGWSGGGLGRSGEGIVEPIAPNAAYATNKQGLGKAEIQESFDKRGCAVSKTLKHSYGPKAIDNQRLRKESKAKQNQKPKRSQFTTKMHSKANKKQLKEILTTSVLEQILDFVQNEREVELLFDKNLTNVERKIVHNLIDEISCIHTCDVGNITQMELIEQIVEYNDYDLHTESSGKQPNRQLGVYKGAKDFMFLVIPEDLREEDIGDNEKEKIDESKDDSEQAEENTNEGFKFVVKEVSSSNSEEKSIDRNITKGAINDATDKIKNQNTGVIHLGNDDSTSNTDKEISFQSLFKKAEFPINKKFRKKLAEEEQKLVFKDELAKNVSSKTFTVIEVLEKVVEYLIDFVNDNSFSEFRFLGSFNETEYDAVGIFFDICSGDTSDNSEVAEKLRKALDSNTHCYNLGVNSNGTTMGLPNVLFAVRNKAWEDIIGTLQKCFRRRKTTSW